MAGLGAVSFGTDPTERIKSEFENVERIGRRTGVYPQITQIAQIVEEDSELKSQDSKAKTEERIETTGKRRQTQSEEAI